MHKEADLQAVHNLIALISNPEAAKAHLDELAKHSAGADQARIDRIASNRALAEARDQVEKNNTLFAQQRAAIDARKNELDAREAALSERERMLGPREQAVQGREAVMASAEGTLRSRQDLLTAGLDALAKDRAEFEVKRDALRALAS